jgi:hypothetical protein
LQLQWVNRWTSYEDYSTGELDLGLLVAA